NTEALAAGTTVKIAVELSYESRLVDGDSKAIIEAVRQGRSDLSEEGKFVDQIYCYVNNFASFSALWTRRTGNSAAKYLAKFALEVTESCT
ncbi:unnamed protein product, partial [Ilex paraguariensis]